MNEVLKNINKRLIHMIRIPIYFFPISAIVFINNLRSSDTILNKLPQTFTIGLFFLSNLLSLFYIYWVSKKISEGKNWSRLLYTVSSILGFYFAFSHQNEVGTNDLLSHMFFIIFTAANIYALLLLYGNKEVVSSFNTN